MNDCKAHWIKSVISFDWAERVAKGENPKIVLCDRCGKRKLA